MLPSTAASRSLASIIVWEGVRQATRVQQERQSATQVTLVNEVFRNWTSLCHLGRRLEENYSRVDDDYAFHRYYHIESSSIQLTERGIDAQITTLSKLEAARFGARPTQRVFALRVLAWGKDTTTMEENMKRIKIQNEPWWPGSLLIDQEDFYGAVMKVLNDNNRNINNLIIIEIRDKV